MRITWLGHSSVLLDVDGVRLLADPLLRDRVRILRRTEPVPESAALGPVGVEAVLLSHLHDDHCDLRSIRGLDAPVVVAPPGAGRWLTAQGVRGVAELHPGTSMAVGPVLVHAVRAEHDGRRRPWGPPACAVGHVVTGTASAWLAGDTALHEGMLSVSELAGPPGLDVAVLPVWGWGPRLGPGHLNPAQAAEAALLGAGAARGAGALGHPLPGRDAPGDAQPAGGAGTGVRGRGGRPRRAPGRRTRRSFRRCRCYRSAVPLRSSGAADSPRPGPPAPVPASLALATCGTGRRAA